MCLGYADTPCETPTPVVMVCQSCWDGRIAGNGGDESEALRQLIREARSLGWVIEPKKEPKKRTSAPKPKKPQGPQLSLLGENA